MGRPTYYLRSTILGGRIVAELNRSGSMTRGFVYQGSQLLAVLADIAFNAVATAHGEGLMRGSIALGDIANRIRSEVCGN